MNDRQEVQSERICIYCLERKRETAFNREHVIPQAFGLFETNLVLQCVCRECNTYFGDTIDLKFARDSGEAIHRYIDGLKPTQEFKSLGGKSTTRLEFKDKGMGEAGYQTASTDGGPLLVFAFPQVGFQTSEGDYKWFRFEDAPDRMQLARLGFALGTLRVRFREVKLEAAHAYMEKNGFVLQGDVEVEPQPAGIVETEIVATIGRSERRVATKIALNYLAAILGSGTIRATAFDECRNFARYDSGESRVHISRNPWEFGPKGEPKWKGHYLAAQSMPSGRILVQVSVFLKVRYVVHAMSAEFLTGPVHIDSAHFFDIDRKIVWKIPVPPLVQSQLFPVKRRF